MVLDVDVFGARSELWQSSQLNSTRVVFKSLAKYSWFSTDDFESVFLEFSNEVHEWYRISQRFR